MASITIDFVAKHPWRMVLVEEGPWDDIESQLRRLQDRLYTAMDAAIDGQLAEQFPESSGQEITIELHGYSLPQEQVSEFFSRFSAHAATIPDYVEAIEGSPHVSFIRFVARFEQIGR